MVAKWTGDLDIERMHQRLNGETGIEADEPEVVLDEVEVHMPAAYVAAPNALSPHMPAARMSATR